MKKLSILLLMLAVSAVQLAAQQALKIKVKKGNILVNDVLWGHCESKGGFFKGYTYKFTNIEGTPLLTVSNAYLPSLFRDSTYTYTRFIVHPKQDTIGIDDVRLFAGNNIETIVTKFLIEKYKLLDQNGLSEEGYNQLIQQNHDTLPKNLRALMTYQQGLRKHIGYVLPRQKREAAFSTLDPEYRVKDRGDYKASYLNVYQDGQKIASVFVYQKKNSSTVGGGWDIDSYLEVFNMKGSKIGYYESKFDGVRSSKTGRTCSRCVDRKITDPFKLSEAIASHFIRENEL